MSDLVLDGFSVTLAGRRIVEDVSLCARAGELTAIIGPNGSGKSTLMKGLSGEHRYAGSARLNGHEIAGLAPAVLARQRAVLPQHSVITFPMTVTEVVGLGFHARRPQPELIGAALERVGLSGFGGRLHETLSGGEQQRAQLARVLVQIWEPVNDGAPCWLFLDEPVSSLDIHHQILIMDLARAYARAGGGVLAVMHDLNLTAMYADRVIALRCGRCAACGPTADTLTGPVLSGVYGCRLAVNETPADGTPFILPHLARGA
ncbi:heme ABC transporter ATP-binding protein [Pannonibacter tanglangensis]|uniref:Heme ABC transporter ATP-binding protein n=1 Tax=Pannonibacter tanglangensis TaxID=2750084 RepID=A0ABW9ZBX6_9HYPH|nr:heme ABC transporter ATP-binding protein [Pannonibacter sp. XCT-34]NBN62156.1 heme ABC transporter ATP-binding protein [Pannonibacter sp. XCT-34]